MRRVWILLAVILWPLAGSAEERVLQTADDGRGWEAVGRIDLDGAGLCTGALIAADMVLTAAHCLYDRTTGAAHAPGRMEFLAGFRNGQARAYRNIRRAVAHPGFVPGAAGSSDRVRHDLALLQLEQPIRLPSVIPFVTKAGTARGARVGVVSYAQSRNGVPALQDACRILARDAGVIVTSCAVDFGASGAPILSFENGEARIVSVVSSKAQLAEQRVALGSILSGPLEELQALMARDAPAGSGGARQGAKFVRP